MTDEGELPLPEGVAIVARSWRVRVEEIDAEAYITIPDEIVQELGLEVGMDMHMTIKDGKLIITKA